MDLYFHPFQLLCLKQRQRREAEVDSELDIGQELGGEESSVVAELSRRGETFWVVFCSVTGAGGGESEAGMRAGAGLSEGRDEGNSSLAESASDTGAGTGGATCESRSRLSTMHTS